ncbi:MAG: DUF1353 domain-containing protein [Fusobacterium sp.]|uniref:DUF1353 domain-containing protein n=1 Tax=Fusobacterium sp. TaxID=68766 RepID=UPI0026DCE9C4|nr:DUF1353 domain-containing protein [Fusobacterium sp.]MDO4690963.1 DUF1353 domain-containing protein [Fusobacterium sp.]
MELNSLELKDLKNSKFELLSDYSYMVRDRKIEVPKGFITDFASVPRIFNIFILPYGKHSSASLIHDWLYSKNCDIKATRKEADRIFLEIMKEDLVNIFKRNLMYLAVRAFGWRYFRR